MSEAEQTERKKIGRIKLSDSQELIASLVDDERLDLRIWTDTDRYKGPTRRGVRFFLLDGICEKVFEVLKASDDEFQEMG